MPLFRLLCALCVSCWFASCVSPAPVNSGANSGRQSVGRDYWGHRPGPQGFRTIVIDAGHGGKDSGAVSPVNGLREKDMALDVARRVGGMLNGRFAVRMMRNGDEFIDLDERVRMANNMGDILVSIHFNAGGGGLHGPEVFYWRVDSYGLARRLSAALYRMYPGQNNSRGLVRRRIRLTRNPEIPCVLVECGYLTNGTEAGKIADPNFRQGLAAAIASAVTAQANEGDGNIGPLPPPIEAPMSRPTDAKE